MTYLERFKEDGTNMFEKIEESIIYEQLAEECSELAHISLKMARKLRGNNPTPMTKEEILEGLNEEIADVMLCIDILLEDRQIMSHESVESIMIEKRQRWIQRLIDREKENEG